MNSHSVKKIILYLYGELGRKEAVKLNRHLQKCDDCRLEMQRLRETIKPFRGVEMLVPSSSCVEAVLQLAREKLTMRTSWLKRVGSFPERFVLKTPRPVTVGLGLLALLILSLYVFYEKDLLPFRGQVPEGIGEMTKWENGTADSLKLLQAKVERLKEGEDLLSLEIAEEKSYLDETINDLQEEMEMVKWAMQVSEDSPLDWEIANLEMDMFTLASKLNSI